MRYVILALIMGVHSLSIYGQTAAGGVGNTTDNRFWLDATQLGLTNGSSMSLWTHDGGNSATIYQNNTNRQPIMLSGVLNGYDAVAFDGNNDYMEFDDNSDMNAGGSWLQRSFFVVFTTSSDVTSRQVVYEEGGDIRGFNFYIFNNQLYYGAYNIPSDGVGAPWGPYFSPTPIAANTTYIANLIYEGNDSRTGTVKCYLNNVLVSTINNVGRIYPHYPGTLGAQNRDSYYHDILGEKNRGFQFEGTISEFVHYNYAVNEAQRTIINNYLSAKYDQTLGHDDLYNEDDDAFGNYDHDVAGIGRVDATNQHTDAQNRAIVRINNPRDLEDNEYMIWGHDKGIAQAIETIDVPPTIDARFDRVWRASEIDNQGNAVDVGAVDMLWDLKGLGAVNTTDLVLLIDVNNNGIFADETPIFGVIQTAASSTVYMFPSVAGISDGRRFTIATINSDQTPLPIELSHFDAYSTLQKDVALEWETKTELNNEYFSIERSLDAMNWEVIGRVDGAGTTTATQEYTFLDQQAYEGMAYYRIKQVDFDGSSSYSEIKSVYIEEIEVGTLNIYPNPTTSFIQIESEGVKADEVLVFDMMGRNVTNAVILQQESPNRIQVDMQYIDAGMYLIHTITGTKVIQKN